MGVEAFWVQGSLVRRALIVGHACSARALTSTQLLQSCSATSAFGCRCLSEDSPDEEQTDASIYVGVEALWVQGSLAHRALIVGPVLCALSTRTRYRRAVALLIVVLTWQIKARGVKLYPQDRTDGFPCLWRRLTISVPPMICHRCGIAVDFDAMGGTKQCEGLQSTTAGKGKASHGAGKWRLSRPTPDMLYEAEKQLQRARMEFDLAATTSNRAPDVEKEKEAKVELFHQAQVQLSQLKAQNTTPASHMGATTVTSSRSTCRAANAPEPWGATTSLHAPAAKPTCQRLRKKTPPSF